MAMKPIEILIEAKATGGAEIDALSKRLDDLSSQQALIDSFVKLKKETQEAAAAFAAAQAKAQQLGREIATTSEPTKTQATEFARAREAVNDAKDAYQSAQLKLQGLRGALKENNIETTGLAQKQAELRKGVNEVEASVAGANARLKEMGAAGPKAASDTAQATDRAANSANSYQGALKEIAGAVAGAFAVGKVVDFAKSVGEISDQYKNLQARIQLVTGEGENFKQSWQGVTDVALRTHSALEETGVLFTRLVQASKDAGMSAEAASAQSLALTETINQAIQLSGAGAQASSAAITQLVQGLQGGVLRGDEFNSIMEQSPRLARALADGLGVTTGELRKMAAAGALTSDTVINALKGQSDTVAAEFNKLPPTVGRALQDLSTQWTLYVAETDKATGASTAAATVINALAGNLQTIAGLLLDVGQAGAALAALKLAQHFLGIGAAAQGAAAAVAATNAQMVATGAAAASAATAASKFSVVLGGLRTFTLVGLVTNFKDIGTWIGETAAKLAGYKDRTEELAEAEKVQAAMAKEAAADRARLAASIQAAIDKQFELSNAARAGVAEFEKLTKEGASSAEAIKKVSASFDLSNLQGIKDFSAVLDKLTADGKVSASELEKAWSQALSGKDLAQFEVMARAAFAGSAREGERIAQMMDGVLREAVKRTGLDFDQLQGSIGAASRSAINDLDALVAGMDRLKAQGLDTGRALTASFSKAIESADSEKALEVIRAKVEQVRNVLGDKIADGLLDQAKDRAEALADALDKSTPGINNVREAMKQLGITSDAALKETAATAKDAYDTLTASGTASARELGEAFRKSAEAAIAANNGIAPSWVAAEASTRGYKVQVDAAGKATLEATKTAKAGLDDVAAGHRSAGAAAREQVGSVQSLADAYTDAGAKAMAAQGQFLAAAQAQKNADTSASSITNRKPSEQQFAWTRSTIIDYLKQAGLEDVVAEELSKQFLNAQGGVDYEASSAQKRWAGKYGTLAEALGKVAEYSKYDEAGKIQAQDIVDRAKRDKEIRDRQRNPSAPAPSPTPAPAPGPGTGTGGNSYINNITINGVGDWGMVRGQTRHTDADSAKTEVDLLRALAQARGAAIQ